MSESGSGPRSGTALRQLHQAAFVRRGLATLLEAQRSGTGIPAEQVIARLQGRLDAARQTKPRRG